jgi:hypothetical protein
MVGIMTEHEFDSARPASGLLLRQPNGLGVPSAQPRDPFGVWTKRERQYRTGGRQWLSPLAYYLGPFEGANALIEAQEFFRRTNLGGKPPQVYLTATEAGIKILPTSNWMMRLVRGTQSAVSLAYGSLESVEFTPAKVARMSVTMPGTSSKLGQVILRTNDARTATISGTTVDTLSAFLQSLGAHIV